MRNPLLPSSPTAQVFVYFGIYPMNTASGGKLHWKWSSDTSYQTANFAFDSSSSNNDYWVASFTLPNKKVGIFQYYVEATPTDIKNFAPTFIWGTDTDTYKGTSEAAAMAAPFVPVVRLPVKGEVVISELMVNARNITINESDSEWFEVYSKATQPISLNTCIISDTTVANAHTITDPLYVLWPNAYSVMGATMSSTNMDGFMPDYAYGSGKIVFGNAMTDWFQIGLPGTVNDPTTLLDKVTWDAAAGTKDGSSVQLKAAKLNDVDNDSVDTATAGNWCLSASLYPTANKSYGTPKGPPDCP
jgi:hypothetical protein